MKYTDQTLDQENLNISVVEQTQKPKSCSVFLPEGIRKRWKESPPHSVFLFENEFRSFSLVGTTKSIKTIRSITSNIGYLYPTIRTEPDNPLLSLSLNQFIVLRGHVLAFIHHGYQYYLSYGCTYFSRLSFTDVKKEMEFLLETRLVPVRKNSKIKKPFIEVNGKTGYPGVYFYKLNFSIERFVNWLSEFALVKRER